MTLPTLSVRVAFVSNPNDSSLTWTEIGPAGGAGPGGKGWVRKVQTKRGRERLLRTQVGFQAGTATVALDNRDRRFDPSNSSGAYYPNVQPEKIIQVGATWSGTFYPIWTGFVDDWPQSWPGFSEAEVAVVATDYFKSLGIARVLSSGYPKQVLADGATQYWRLGEPSRTAGVTLGTIDFAANQVGSGVTGTYKAGYQLGGTPAMVGDPTSSVNLMPSGATPAGFVSIPPFGATSLTFTIEAWVSGNWADGTGNCEIFSQSDASGSGVSFYINGPGALQGMLELDVSDDSGHFTAYHATSLVPADGSWHHVAATYNNGPTTLYVDGVAVATTGSQSATVPGTTTPNLVVLGAFTDGVTPAFPGSLQDVAYYPSVLSGAQLLKHYNLGAFSQQTTDGYITQVLGWLGLPSSRYSVQTGYTLCLKDTQSEVNTKVIDLLQKIEQTEQGQLYVGADGTLQFKNRYNRYVNPNLASQATIGDGGAAFPSEIPYAMGGVTLNYDRVELYNDISVTRRGGRLQNATSPGSITSFGNRAPAGLSDVLMVDDTNALYCAQWIVADTAQPQFRVGKLVIDPRVDNRWWPVVLGLDIGAVITINKHNIPGGGPTLSLVCRIEGIEHQIDPPNGWTTTLHVSLTGTNPWLILDDPVTGLLDSGNRLGW